MNVTCIIVLQTKDHNKENHVNMFPEKRLFRGDLAIITVMEKRCYSIFQDFFFFFKVKCMLLLLLFGP